MLKNPNFFLSLISVIILTFLCNTLYTLISTPLLGHYLNFSGSETKLRDRNKKKMSINLSIEVLEMSNLLVSFCFRL